MERIRMKLSLVLLAGATLASAAPVQQQTESDPSPEVPSSMRLFAQADFPYFVAASHLLTSEGRVDPKLVAPGQIDWLEKTLALPEVDGCVQLGPVVIEGFANTEPDNLESAAMSAMLVVEGRVTAARPGFLAGTAGTLLRVAPRRVLANRAPRGQPMYFFFVPVAKFKLGGKTYCKSDAHFGVVPQIGQQVVLIAQALEDAPIIPYTSNSANELITFDPSGKAIFSGRFRSMGYHFDRTELLTRLEAAIAKGAEQ